MSTTAPDASASAASAAGAAPAQRPIGRVGVLVVSHDGARWLPGTLAGLAEQSPSPAHVVGVDTGSRDESADLLEGATASVVRGSRGTSFPAAVRLGLERLDADAPGCEWVWLLHDDARPAPGALQVLLQAAAEHPEVDVLGPKLREWPSLRRLLEVGVTISGTGRRETGLERGEYDQGQHDEPHQVLAVNTAGMLVRRRVLDALDGFDPELPVLGTDLDFGWRATQAGHRVLVVPDAVVFHAEATVGGLRWTAFTGSHPHAEERRAALYTLLVNGRARGLPFQVVRLVLGTVLRAVGFLLARAPREALDDVVALGSVLARPGRLRAARRARSAAATERESARGLLAPRWLPYRHGLDALGDIATAATNQAADVAERRRVAAAALDPSSQAARRPQRDDEDDDELADSGAIARFFTNPVVLAMMVVVVVCLVAARTAFGAVAGGGLAPTPDAAGDWWHLWTDSWHRLGAGTDVPAPPLVAPLAVLATVLGTTGAVSAVLVLAVPVGIWGAWRLLRVTGRLVSPVGLPRWLLVTGATAYGLVPVSSGAWGEGRLGLVLAMALLPWVAHAALGFADPDPDRRWRAAWRSGLLLTLACCGAPLLWWFALALTIVVLVGGALVLRLPVTDRRVSGPPAVAVLVVPVLLSPWWVPAIVHGAAQALLLDSGRLPGPGIGPVDVLLGRVGDLGAPSWAGALLVLLAVLGLVPRATRIPVLMAWLVGLLAVVVAALAGLFDLRLTAVDAQPGLGVLVAVLQGALVTAAVLGGQGAVRGAEARQSGAGEGGLRHRAGRAVAAVLAVAAVSVPAAGLVWFLIGDDDLSSEPETVVPAYMVQSSRTGPEHGVLVVRGSVGSGLSYVVRRDDGVTLGEDEIISLAARDPALDEAVSVLVSRPTGAVIDRLGELGVEYVLLPAPVDGAVAAALDATTGLTQASSDAGSRAWQVSRPLDPDAADGPGSPWRVLLLVEEGVAVLVVLVLALPTLRPRPTRGAREGER